MSTFINFIDSYKAHDRGFLGFCLFLFTPSKSHLFAIATSLTPNILLIFVIGKSFTSCCNSSLVISNFLFSILLQVLHFIESIDTSNPIMAAIGEMPYTKMGLHLKPMANMNKHQDISKEFVNEDLVDFNVEMFRTINGL